MGATASDPARAIRKVVSPRECLTRAPLVAIEARHCPAAQSTAMYPSLERVQEAARDDARNLADPSDSMNGVRHAPENVPMPRAASPAAKQ
jgi:hypothetical protein